MERTPIKMGVIAELTGPLSFIGVANANVCRMVIEDMNEAGGLLGRPVELTIEDGQTDDAAAKAAAAKLVNEDNVDLVVGGIFSSTRQATRSEATERGDTLYIYPEQYEGQEDDPLIFCTGPVPAQQVESLVPWLMETTGARKFYPPSADYIWPHLPHAVSRGTLQRWLHRKGRQDHLHLLRRELPEPRSGRAYRRALYLPRLLSGDQRSL